VAILGETGRNFGAGMSGGVAYVIDPDGSFGTHFNSAIADLLNVTPGSADDRELKGMIQKHLDYTGSKVARKLLADWPTSVKQFKKVFPRDYARFLRKRAATGSSNGVRSGVGDMPGTREEVGSRG
jgi:glutamate synthase (ferredoxin)